MTLAEVMVSLGFLTMALFALLAVQTFGITMHTKLDRRHTASLLAASLTSSAREVLRQEFRAELDRPRTPSGVEGYEYQLEQIQLGPRLVGLQVTVFWKDEQGAQDYRLATKFSRP